VNAKFLGFFTLCGKKYRSKYQSIQDFREFLHVSIQSVALVFCFPTSSLDAENCRWVDYGQQFAPAGRNPVWCNQGQD
jgi:hypothetical protein